jgi:tetratricopeptide (TPR) repeat protein
MGHASRRSSPFVLSVPLCLCVFPLCFATAEAAGTQIAQAEKLAQQASGLCQGGSAAEGEALARKALLLTEEFEPTDYVRAGRKGEVVEDEFLEARRQYRIHRAKLYDAVGECLARGGKARPATRYLGRADLLQPTADRAVAYARALLADQRPGEALFALRKSLRSAQAALSAEGLRLLEQGVDGERLGSAQVTLDRWRVAALKAPNVTHVAGPLKVAGTPRLSTGAPFAWGEDPMVFYVGSVSCRECSAQMQEIQGALAAYRRRAAKDGGPEVKMVLLPEEPDQDQALRQLVTLYRYDWPVLMGRGHPAALGVKPGDLLVVGRRGWSAVKIQPPFEEALGSALDLLARREVNETVPRSNWNRQPAVDAVVAQPKVLPEGLAPGEDPPAPAAFTAAVDAFRAGRALETLRFMDALAADEGGWLLPPEARYNRALALRATGDREAARRILLRIGDSRFQEDVDRALEAPGKRR